LIRCVALGYPDMTIQPRLQNDAPVRTDSGNLIYDCAFGAISDAPKLAAVLSAIPGVVEHGLFIGIATTLLVAHPGEVEVIPRRT
jgi:ribose 5-phosphate isomerase A